MEGGKDSWQLYLCFEHEWIMDCVTIKIEDDVVFKSFYLCIFVFPHLVFKQLKFMFYVL